MYRVSYEKLLELLTIADCEAAIGELERRELSPKIIRTVEVDYTIEDEGTEDEILVINEFNIYTTNNTIIFGIQLKHDHDFTTEWARTSPIAEYKVMEKKIEMPYVDPIVKESLDYLMGLALDAYESKALECAQFAEDREKGYKECDAAYAAIAGALHDTTSRMNEAHGRVGDLSRHIADQQIGIEEEKETNDRIDEIYKLLEEKPNGCTTA